ncbi:MAG: hypothetical protein WC551_06640 [Patescibacteria group bacterium]
MKLRHLLPVSAFGLLLAFPAKAVCPVCTIAVGAGLGLSRWLGVDDTVSGTWVGALLVSISIWTKDWLAKKKIVFPGATLVFFLVYVALTFVPLWLGKIIGHPYNTLWGADKLILGSAFGCVIFYASAKLYEFLKKKNGGHAHFKLEKVVLPVSAIAVLSVIFYFITR